MKTQIKTLTFLCSLGLVCAGCSSPLANFSKIVDKAGTDDKDIDIIFNGRGLHGEYHSKRRFTNDWVTGGRENGGIFISQPALRIQQVKP